MEDKAYTHIFYDILEQVLQLSENPREFAEYLTKQIRELIGARIILIATLNENTEIKVVSVLPTRHTEFVIQKRFIEFIRHTLEYQTVQYIESQNLATNYSEVLKDLKIEKSIIIPLIAANRKVGVLLLLDIMDSFGIEAILSLFQKLSGVFALIIRNSILYHNLEDTVEQRTKELQKQNNELIAREYQLQCANEEFEAINEELRQANEQLSAAKEKAEEADRLKSAFLANMSHEIRTPMNGILGFSELLVEPDLTEEKKKQFVQIISNCGNQLMSLIDDLIDIAKIESNQLKIVKTKTNVNNLLFELFNIFKSKSQNTNINLYLTQPLSDADSEVETDGNRLRQIISNLLSNALKFTHTGSITFGYQIIEGYMKFFVEDTGIGIAPEKLAVIFERFRQADESTAENYGGSGLGLAISKSLTNLLGGRIWAESIVNFGSTFYFTIPFENKNTVQETEKKLRVEINANRKVILIAEDNDVNYIYLEELLCDTNYKLLHAKNGKEAVQIYNKNKVDLILIDVKMPLMSGYQVVREIRKTNLDIPIIAQTAYALIHDREQAIEAGCSDYLSKPIRRNELLAKIKNLIGE